MSICTPADVGSLLISTETPTTIVVGPDTTVDDSIVTQMLASTYLTIARLNSWVWNAAPKEIVFPTLDGNAFELKCSLGKSYSVSFGGTACVGDPGYDEMVSAHDANVQRFMRFDWLGSASGDPAQYGMGFINLPTLVGAPGALVTFTGTANFSYHEKQNLP